MSDDGREPFFDPVGGAEPDLGRGDGDGDGGGVGLSVFHVEPHLAVGEEMTLGARSTTIGRVRPGFLAPFFAGMLALSSAARLQSIRLAQANSLKN